MSVANCFNHHVRVGDKIGLYLVCALYGAERNRETILAEKTATTSFLEFLLEAEDKSKLMNCDGFPLVTSMGYVNDGSPNRGSHHAGLSFGRMSNLVNDYLSAKGVDREKFYEEYFKFVGSCKKTAENILKTPEERVAFEQSDVYENFMDCLKDVPDRPGFDY